MRFALLTPVVVAACASHSPAATPSPAQMPTPVPTQAPAPTASELFAAIAKKDAAHVADILTASPALVDATNPKGHPAVLVAMFGMKDAESFLRPRDNATLQALLARRPTLDRFLAAAFGDAERVRTETGRDAAYVRARSPIGWTALHFAAFADNASTAGALLDAGADVNAVADNSFRNAPLQVTMLTQAVDVARLLLARGADVRHRQEGGFTALHEAVQGGNRDLVAALLDAGADPLAAADDGRTAVDLARVKNDPDLSALLTARLPR
jgi:uncharacterized protein